MTRLVNFSDGNAEMRLSLQSKGKICFSTMETDRKGILCCTRDLVYGVGGKSTEPQTICVLEAMKVKFCKLISVFQTHFYVSLVKIFRSVGEFPSSH